MGSSIRITNAAGRDGSVQVAAPHRDVPPELGLPGHKVMFRRYLACTEASRHVELAQRFGDDYSSALIESDPEIDIEHVGRTIEETNIVYLNAAGEFLRSPPSVIEVVFGPDGVEKDRRQPVDVPPNVDSEMPVRWTGRKFPIKDAVRRFAFRRSVQLLHVDGVTYDFLFGMASELAKEGVVMLLGAGPKGVDPLVFQANGRPCRGFLEGRVEGERYQLLIHLSDMELKLPSLAKHATEKG